MLPRQILTTDKIVCKSMLGRRLVRHYSKDELMKTCKLRADFSLQVQNLHPRNHILRKRNSNVSQSRKSRVAIQSRLNTDTRRTTSRLSEVATLEQSSLLSIRTARLVMYVFRVTLEPACMAKEEDLQFECSKTGNSHQSTQGIQLELLFRDELFKFRSENQCPGAENSQN